MRFGRGRRRRVPGSSARRQLRRLAVLLAVAVTIASITGYVVISFTVNGLPSYQPSTGWVAVLQPAATPDVDTVQLLVQARTQGSQTRAAYDVVVCGPRPYTGDLLIGGSALLTAIQPSPVFPGSAPPPLRVLRIPDLVFIYNGVIDLGAVQLVHISLPYVIACPPAAGVQSSGALPGGSVEGVIGVTARPVQQNWAGWWGWWHGPHASQAWPLTGTIPGVPSTVTGEFMAVSGLTGNWVRPLSEYSKVVAVGVPVSWSVDSAIPTASGPYPLIWQSRNPIEPMVRLTDNSSLALLQDWVVIFAVAFGIAGSMLASMLLEWLRRRPQQADTASRRQPQAKPATATPTGHPSATTPEPGLGRSLALVGAIILIGYVRSRLARGRRESFL